MRYFAVFFILVFSAVVSAQTTTVQKISGKIVNDYNLETLSNVNIVNLNKVRASSSDDKGAFQIEATANDTLLFSLVGFQSIRVRVTNDWIKNATATIQLTESAIALEEVVIQPYVLTGYLEVDTKLIPVRENYRYSISGLQHGYEAGEYAPGAFGNVLGSIFNPADMLYNFFGKKPRELNKLKEFKRDSNMRTMLASKYDHETIAALLGITKNEIPEILARCNYSESFVATANDLQIMDAINECYEEYKILKKKN